MTDTIGYSLDDLRERKPLLADFLFAAPDTHSYNRLFAQSENPPEDFLQELELKGGFAQGLLNNNLGEAAMDADPENGAILYDVIQSSPKYAIIEEDRLGEGFGSNTVPVRWAKDYQ